MPLRTTRLALIVPAALVAGAAHAQSSQTPTPTTVSPTIVTRGEPITITGTSLAPPRGWSVTLVGSGRYGSNVQVAPSSVSATQLRFPAPDANESPMRLRYSYPQGDTAVSTSAILTGAREPVLPSGVVVQGPPGITWVGPNVSADVGNAFRALSVQGGQATIKGKWLRRTTMPTVTFGSAALTALQHAYEPTGFLYDLSGNGSGADRLVFAVPAQKGTRWLVVAHPLGRDSALVTFTPPPVVSELRLQDGTTTRVISAGQALQRGRTYILRGQHLSITHVASGATSIKRGRARLGTVDVAPSFASDTNLVFTVPTTFTATSAALAAVTLMGTTTVGTYPITSELAAIGVASVSPASATLISGQQYLFRATLDIPTNTPESALGGVRVLLPPGATNALSIAANGYPVSKANPTEVKVRAGDLPTATPFTMTVAHESNVLNGQPTATKAVAVTVRPPHPVGFKDAATLTAGGTRTVAVVLDSATRTNSGLLALLSSSNPNVITVPPSATMSGNLAAFSATIPPLLQPTTATLTATADGVTATQVVNVVLPVASSVTASSSTALPGETIAFTASFTGTLGDNVRPNFILSDTALTFDPNRGYQVSGSVATVHYRVSSGLSASRQVTATVGYGGQTRSTTVTLQPITLTGWSATPASGRPGDALQATALKASSALNHQLEVTSGDTTLVKPDPFDANFAGASKVVVLRLRGTPTTSRQVAVAVALRASGVVVSTRTLTVTVNP